MLAIIPARGGSKGLPGKNIKLLKGKPLIAYTIEAALNADMVTRVIVSTDDLGIATVAREYGAEVPFMRPVELASDSAKAVDVFKYTLKRLEEEGGGQIDSFVVLQPTSPLRTSDDIDQAISMFVDKNADSVVSYCPEQHPIVWHRYIADNGKLIDIFEPNKIRNRQDEKMTYYPNGAIYVIRKELINKDAYYTENSYAYIMDNNRSIDIDTLMDFKFAEFLITNKS
ncbi:N-acylneuraminate cytidylyltransferase/CMP-N,N'-diacetyllegionaminic acid synthase [Arachidicoccus rhizosphaerae]|uniref:N-acylneuraminate cytidylyltransferase/CMP-N,N'-diacetyllegionaminic acid synthase n=1 Tax=Arachidicoccus rhizosphaerae TaxID=551991 RepID=A0A1H4CPF1_9BACT|nr:acylneuraminate cytidylyltransferase family protein [Arachidicoccus rhizosphaerae]SEA62178.1 N-acylneuraminate cytidylyltransferase/CMP-N,N'-diacetyllegionaminic acid synthase [Arachidicoccus rhizosphaerae]